MHKSYNPMRTTNNVLIAKDGVGFSKPCVNPLPPPGFIYGKSAGYDLEGAKEVTMSWRFHDKTRNRRAKKDFKKLNKMSVVNGMVSAKDFYKFRRFNSARQAVIQGKTQLEILLPEEQFRYGIRNRPSTPIERVVSNDYQREKLVKVQQLYQQRAMQQFYKESITMNMLPKINKTAYLTATTTRTKLYNMNKQHHNQKLFKLKRWNKVRPKTSTLRGKYRFFSTQRTARRKAKQQPPAVQDLQVIGNGAQQ